MGFLANPGFWAGVAQVGLAAGSIGSLAIAAKGPKGSSGSKAPKVQAPAKAAGEIDRGAEEAAEREAERRRAGSQRSTILTGPLGVQGGGDTAKTILGGY